MSARAMIEQEYGEPITQGWIGVAVLSAAERVIERLRDRASELEAELHIMNDGGHCRDNDKKLLCITQQERLGAAEEEIERLKAENEEVQTEANRLNSLMYGEHCRADAAEKDRDINAKAHAANLYEACMQARNAEKEVERLKECNAELESIAHRRLEDHSAQQRVAIKMQGERDAAQQEIERLKAEKESLLHTAQLKISALGADVERLKAELTGKTNEYVLASEDRFKLRQDRRSMEQEIVRLTEEVKTEQRNWIEDDRDLNGLIAENERLKAEAKTDREWIEGVKSDEHRDRRDRLERYIIAEWDIKYAIAKMAEIDAYMKGEDG